VGRPSAPFRCDGVRPHLARSRTECGSSGLGVFDDDPFRVLREDATLADDHDSEELMPAYRFSWEAFDNQTALELARDIGFTGDAARALDFLAGRVARPNDDFIRRTKDTLARIWLPQHEGVAKAVVRELFDMRIGPLGQMPQDAGGCAEYVMRCRNTSRLRDLLFRSLISYGDKGDETTFGEGFVPSFGVVAPKKQASDLRQPYPHQEEAWSKLDAHLREADGAFNGVLVMPTGSGKTYTAAHWLTRRWIDGGRRVLWIAHREELLAQAARAFAQCSVLASNQERIRIRQVSTRTCRFHQIDPEDHVVCCSVHSLARAPRAEAAKLLHDPRVFVVIDEAHHAPAKSYRDAIEILQEAKAHRLLGLTATPTRTAEKERPELKKLFGGRIIFQVSTTDLIAKGLLAHPHPATVKTTVDAELGMTPDDRQHLVTFHEPSSEMLARLGSNEGRNRVIVEEYARNRSKYGKTLVFTTDVAAAALLADAFRGANIEAQYLASYRPDLKEGERVERREVLRAYADPQSGLDVLINVDMLTEGVDLPVTKTAFLARPTSSEILFRQMVGRALRGPRAGGNSDAYIVSFEDHWSTYFDYLSPLDWLADESHEETPAEPLPPRESPKAGPAEEAISWEQVLSVARGIRAAIPDSAADVFEAVPHGMFVLDYEAEGEAVRRVIHVYAHQQPCWLALFGHLRGLSKQLLASADAAALDGEFFGDCDAPRASSLDVAAVVERVKAGDSLPEYVELVGRSACDPRELAKHAREKDLRRTEENALLAERYGQLARVLYPTMLEYRRAFDDALRELEHPGASPAPKGVPLFEPPPSNPLRPGPFHDVRALMADVLRHGGNLLGRPLQHDGTIQWSRRPIKGWYGKAWPTNEIGRGDIRLNVILDSPDFSAATLRYLLWHEYLHLYLMDVGHTNEFRKLEKMWPESATCDREMDSLNERFGVQYW
jgi:superfamily II DNA or RNA helicase